MQQETFLHHTVKVCFANMPEDELYPRFRKFGVTERYDDQTGSRYYEWPMARGAAIALARQFSPSVTLTEISK